MAVYRTNLHCDACGQSTPHRFEYPSDFQNTAICEECESVREIDVRVQEKVAGSSAVVLTTAPWLEGYRVEETIDIVTAECVLGVSIFKELLSGLTDAIGGRSGTTQKLLRRARQTCLSELRGEAASVGANAVIAVSLAYSEISGGGKEMLFLVASGTAVRIAPNGDADGELDG